MPIDAEFLSILVCPTTRQPLRYASAQELAAINVAVADGTARTAGGATIQEPVEEGLVVETPEDAAGSVEPPAVVYPIRENVPVLLAEEAIRLPSG